MSLDHLVIAIYLSYVILLYKQVGMPHPCHILHWLELPRFVSLRLLYLPIHELSRERKTAFTHLGRCKTALHHLHSAQFAVPWKFVHPFKELLAHIEDAQTCRSRRAPSAHDCLRWLTMIRQAGSYWPEKNILATADGQVRSLASKPRQASLIQRAAPRR
ncbi:hypothetical protein B0H66DRAFT_236676 [Apodospora peruviana]|uniref:Uncharacterized protein n=1 Tax=Apodospora peruviana TaxID=516989 RepID=A0AAE0I4F6_9PEZI|nr:hypothetical protein B0H66DRAFT_236676 [Apodospora peruviana]